MDKKICRRCKADNEETRYFCAQCGAFLESASFAPEAYDLPQMKIMRIVDNLRHMKPGERVPDEAFAFHAERIERLQALCGLPEFAKNAGLIENMGDCLALCRHPEFQIAFVGTIKTGKSTLINALLGKNYASMAVTPETAALTKFRVSARDYVKVTFYTAKEWSELWTSRHHADKFMEEYLALNAESQRAKWVGHVPVCNELTNDEVEEELSKWSSSKSPEHYFVKEIEVGISSLPKDFPAQVVFVDTPGLFDPVAYRSELTKQYIRRANAVFVCVDAQKVQQQEIETISTVLSISSNNREKVHIIATHWDKLNDPERDWKEQKAWLVRQLTGKGFFAAKDIAAKNIMHTAAYIHILCREYEHLDKQEIRSLQKFALNYDDFDADSAEDRQKMMEKANIHAVFHLIRDQLAGNYRKYLMEDVENKFSGICGDLRRIANDSKEDAQELLSASKSELSELKAAAEKKKEQYERIKAVSGQLKAMLDQVEETTARQMETVCGQLRAKIEPTYKPKEIKQQRSLLRSLAKTLFGRGRK